MDQLVRNKKGACDIAPFFYYQKCILHHKTIPMKQFFVKGNMTMSYQQTLSILKDKKETQEVEQTEKEEETQEVTETKKKGRPAKSIS